MPAVVSSIPHCDELEQRCGTDENLLRRHSHELIEGERIRDNGSGRNLADFVTDGFDERCWIALGANHQLDAPDVFRLQWQRQEYFRLELPDLRGAACIVRHHADDVVRTLCDPNPSADGIPPLEHTSGERFVHDGCSRGTGVLM
jgi:hypothetical protein